MSTVFVDTIKNQTGTTSLAANKLPDMLSGSSKVWCCWNGTGTAAVRDSHNISSLTDNGSGDFTFDYTSNFSSANYTIAGCFAHSSAITNYSYNTQPRENSVVTASNVRLITVYVGASVGIADYPYATFETQGDLA